MNYIQQLKDERDQKTKEWRQTKDEYLKPTYTKIGNFLRQLQNEGRTITELTEIWGTKDRRTVLDLLKYATTPHNGLQYRSRSGKPLPAPVPVHTQAQTQTIHKDSPTEVRIQDLLEPVGKDTVRTKAPIPPEMWAVAATNAIAMGATVTNATNTKDYAWPTKPWEGEATWDENGLLTTPDGAPLHLLQMILGGMTELYAKNEE